MNKIDRIKKITALLNKASDAYYNTGSTIMEDREFDALMEELRALEQETGFIMATSPTQTVGYEVKSSLNKVKHNHPMLSLNKTKDWNEFIKYFGSKDVVGMPKLDGLTCSLRYIDGALVSAETRGNGEIGEDILHNIKTVRTVPKNIPYKDEFVIDGEIICTHEDFKPFFEEYKNPRNFASGSIRLLDSNECAERPLTFVVWNVIKGFGETNSFLEKLEFAKRQGFVVVPWTSSFDWDAKEFLIEKAEKLGYPIDGLVGRFDDIQYGESLGATSHHSNAAYAYKFYDQVYETTLLDVEWNPTRTGLISPVAVFEEIDLDGALTTRATLHNLSIIKQLELGIGDKITVYRSNMVIPKIDDNLSRSNTLIIPKKCPCCGVDTIIKDTDNSQVLMCPNPDCTAKKIAQFTHFVSRKCMNIDGLSEKTLETLISHGFLHSYKDIYHLSDHYNEIIRLEGFGKKSIDNLLKSIEDSRNVNLANFICALGIPNIGSSASKTIAEHCEYDIAIFLKLLWESRWNTGFKWTELNDFGEVVSKSLDEYFDKNAKIIRELADEMNFIIPAKKKVDNNPFVGKTLCVTGKLNHFTRESINEKIASLGAKAASSVSKKTDYLITNEASGSSKYKKAIELNVPIITEDEFVKMLN